MKLTYWYARCLGDNNCYSIRARTKREAVAQKRERNHAEYGPVVKVQVEYRDGFDLVEQCNGEGGLIEEGCAHYAAETKGDTK